MRFSRTPTTVDITWFLDLNVNKQINLNPPYQRKSVWTTKDRRFFLDTIFRGYPVPAIYVFKETSNDGKSTYHVVDGKQRLETIFKFADNKIALAKDFGNVLLDGKRWFDIKKDPELAKQFWDYVIPIEFIRISDDPKSINDVFDRLNRNAKTLTEQELRHAKYDGWFITFIENESDRQEWRDVRLTTNSRRKRMKDVQFFAQLFMLTISNKIDGFDQDLIDNYHALYDDPDENVEEGFDIDAETEKFEAAKRYIFEMERANNCISRFARDYKDFYSVWSVVVLGSGRIGNPADTAGKYADFMQTVAEIKRAIGDGTPVDDFLKSAVTYYYHSIGANTEEPQRIERYNSLAECFAE